MQLIRAKSSGRTRCGSSSAEVPCCGPAPWGPTEGSGGTCSAGTDLIRRRLPHRRASTPSTGVRTPIHRTATSNRSPAATRTGCAPTAAASTTSSSPVTGSTAGSMPAASRRRLWAVCRRRMRSTELDSTRAPRAVTARSECPMPERSLVPERDPFDPLATLRAMGEVQRAGLEAAASVVERILELGRHGARMPYSFHLPAQPVDGADSNGADAEAERARDVRRLRADGERLLEWWGEWMRVLLDAAVDGAEAGVAEREAPKREDQPLRLGPVKAGHFASREAPGPHLDG